MRLSRQLLLVSLLMLTLPWAGSQYLRELELALRQGQEQALYASTRAIAAALAAETDLATIAAATDHGDAQRQQPLYAEAISWPVIVDGYDSEWSAMPARRFSSPEAYPSSIDLRSAIKGDTLYLYLQINDNQVRYQNPAHPVFENGDRLIVHTGGGERYVLLTGAPGELPAFYRRGDDYVLEQAIQAQWQDTTNGYNIELAIPQTLVQGRLGLVLLDEDENGAIRSRLGNMLSADTRQAPTLLYRSPDLNRRLGLFTTDGLRLELINTDRWRIAAHGSLDQSQDNGSHWLIRRLYRSIVRSAHPPYPPPAQVPGRVNRDDVDEAFAGQVQTDWYQDLDNDQRSILSVAIPITSAGSVRAVLLAEESSERFLGLTDQAFQRLLLLGLAAFLITGVGLVSYAAWLSWRIRRLSRTTTQMIDNDSLNLAGFPDSHARDEIGDLTRSFKRLFARISSYTDYLQTFSRKLTHEVRTPLAVVRSSLDNLAEADPEQAPEYLQRARTGAERLSHLITALSEATRVEEAIQQADKEPLNLAAIIKELVDGYRQLHPTKRFEISGIMPMHLAPSRYTMYGSPDLLAQMFDKLIANAVDFTPDNGEIHFHYQEHGRHLIIDLSNDGPLLPAQIRHQIFDQLISQRERKDGETGAHLGLGLYIVRLVVEYHDGHIRAENRPDKRGANFCINLPASGPGGD